MAWQKAEVALVGHGFTSRRPPKLSDVPALQHFRGTPADFSGSVKGACWTHGRGPPVAAVLSQAHLLPGTFIHEVRHMAMDCGMLGLGYWRAADILHDTLRDILHDILFDIKTSTRRPSLRSYTRRTLAL